MVLAYRPFATVQPYAETGPIFLCKEECAAHDPAQGMPESFRSRARFQSDWNKSSGRRSSIRACRRYHRARSTRKRASMPSSCSAGAVG